MRITDVNDDRRVYSKAHQGYGVAKLGVDLFRVFDNEGSYIASRKSESAAWCLCDKLRKAFSEGYEKGRKDFQ